MQTEKLGKTEYDREFCEKLWIEYQPVIYQLCRYKLSSHPDEIEDVVSCTYLALCQAVAEHRDFVNPKAWLLATANNIIKHKYTAINNEREKTVSLSNINSDLPYHPDILDLIVSEGDLLKAKSEIEGMLSEHELMIIKYTYEDNLTAKEIAAIMNLTESAVRQKRYRIVNKVKKMVKDKLNEII